MHKFKCCKKKKVMCVLYWASCEMLFFVKVLVSGFRTPFTLHQVPETLFLNGGIKEFVQEKKKVQLNEISHLIRSFPNLEFMNLVDMVYFDCEWLQEIPNSITVNSNMCMNGQTGK